jgi:formylglycine-generating enzyme required for sulfatase activity
MRNQSRTWKRVSFVGILLLSLAFPGCEKDPGPAGPHSGPSHQPPVRQALMEYSGIAFTIVPAGSNLAGSPVTEPGRNPLLEDERPISFPAPFALSAYEVTRGQYWAVLDPARSVPASEAGLPMVDVTWQQAFDFCEKLKERHSGKRFRLPGEWEWEYACRAGRREMFSPWDAELAEALERLRIDNDHKKLPRLLRSRFNFDASAVTPVGSYPPNGWGLHDMHGNVAEWCALPAPNEPDDAPSLSHRPLRGGSWSWGGGGALGGAARGGGYGGLCLGKKRGVMGGG